MKNSITLLSKQKVVFRNLVSLDHSKNNYNSQSPASMSRCPMNEFNSGWRRKETLRESAEQ